LFGNAALSLCLAMAATAFAQDQQTATVTIYVSAVEAGKRGLAEGATLIATDQSTGVVHSEYLNGSRPFQFSLPPGLYTVRINKDGFQQIQYANVELRAGQHLFMSETLRRLGEHRVDSGPPHRLLVSEIEVSLLVRSHGCGRDGCAHYRVTVSGDGRVNYEDLVEASRQSVLKGRHERGIPVDDVVDLVNEFLLVRFFERPARYEGRNSYRRVGDTLQLLGRTGSDYTEYTVRIRLGALEKSVFLYLDYPDDLARLRDRINELGGPQAWSTQ
jgi:hypothetical protein